jgi:hypothetical protein
VLKLAPYYGSNGLAQSTVHGVQKHKLESKFCEKLHANYDSKGLKTATMQNSPWLLAFLSEQCDLRRSCMLTKKPQKSHLSTLRLEGLAGGFA